MSKRSDWQPTPKLWRKLKPLARKMRKEPTAAERKLWQRIRSKQVRRIIPAMGSVDQFSDSTDLTDYPALCKKLRVLFE